MTSALRSWKRAYANEASIPKTQGPVCHRLPTCPPPMKDVALWFTGSLQIEVDGCSAGSNASKMVVEPVRIGPSSSSLATHIHARPRKIWNGITRATIRIRVGRRRAETRQGDPKKRACHLLFHSTNPLCHPNSRRRDYRLLALDTLKRIEFFTLSRRQRAAFPFAR